MNASPTSGGERISAQGRELLFEAMSPSITRHAFEQQSASVNFAPEPRPRQSPCPKSPPCAVNLDTGEKVALERMNDEIMKVRAH